MIYLRADELSAGCGVMVDRLFIIQKKLLTNY